MKNRWIKGIVFVILWVGYCLAVILPSQEKQTSTQVMGLLIGCVFLWGTGLFLLWGIQKLKPRVWQLVLCGIGLAGIDLLVKMWVNATLSGGKAIVLIPGWLAIQYAPNYSNNVLLNLLGIVVDSGWFHFFSKLLLVCIAVGIIYWYFKSQKYDFKNKHFQFGAMLLLAGAVSSTLESGFRGYIIDFIAYANLVAFDFKDLYLMYGIGLLILAVLQWENSLKKSKQEAAPNK